MRLSICLALIAVSSLPALSHAAGKPKVQGYTRKELKQVIAASIETAKPLPLRVETGKNFTTLLSDKKTAQVQIDGTPSHGDIALVSPTFYKGRYITAFVRPVGAAIWAWGKLPAKK